MQIKTCQAESLAALMKKIRTLYGPAGVLLSVRRIDAPDGDAAHAFVIEGTVACGNEAERPALPSRRENVQTANLAERPTDRKAIGQQNLQPLPAIGPNPLRCEMVALVGPMGAGKTTTAAKIAGRLRMQTKKPVGVISTDTERPGGSALLSAYADALSLHATTASSAPDLRNRISRWNCRGPLVIDTRGCSPRDSLAIGRLGSILDGSETHVERFLVLSATEHPAVARECLDAYSEVGFAGVVLARADQAAGIGDCLEEVQKHGSRVVLVGTGERVPDDLMESTVTALAALRSSAGAA